MSLKREKLNQLYNDFYKISGFWASNPFNKTVLISLRDFLRRIKIQQILDNRDNYPEVGSSTPLTLEEQLQLFDFLVAIDFTGLKEREKDIIINWQNEIKKYYPIQFFSQFKKLGLLTPEFVNQ